MATEPVELDSDLVSRVRAATPDVVAYIQAAVRRELDNETFGRLLDQLETETGPVPEEVAAEADRFWHAS